MKRPYSQITLEERRKIERWRHAGVSVDIIAKKLGRHRSSIFRELQRNSFRDKEMPEFEGYYALTAHDYAGDRRSRLKKLSRFSNLREAVVERIRHGWSPEQIAGRLRLEQTNRRTVEHTVCHETIYRFAYSKDAREMKLWQYLPERRARRRSRHARKRHGRRFGPEVGILRRPEIIAKRRQFGHWECDLIQFRKKFGKTNMTSLVERVSRFKVLMRNNDRQSKPIMEGLINALSSLPHQARRSITFNRGTEFSEWSYLQAGLGAQTWFCDPQSPWQKGTVENTNRRARRWLSRDINPMEVDEDEIRDICAHLNSTPRKCLGYRTPAEVFRQKAMAEKRKAG